MSTHDEDPSGPTAGGDEPVGSLGEEATRLLGALSGWVAHSGGTAERHVEDVVRRTVEEVARAAEDFEEHCATGAAECTWCPLCRTIHAVRTVSPEVRTHLGAAALSLVKAASALLAPPSAPPASGSGQSDAAGAERVQRIRLDDDADPT